MENMENLAPQQVSMPRIGDKAPEFKAVTTQGEINFPQDYSGSWVILFSHPADFTPVCTSEFMTFASMEEQFNQANCKLIGLSIDGLYSHIAWLRTIKEKIEFKEMKGIEVNFPLIEDITMEVATKYGMIMPGESSTKAVRAVFVIDPKGIIRTIIYYPLSLGRNFDELYRVIIALQTADEFNVATPADWRPGDEVIVPTAGSCGVAKDRMEGKDEDTHCYDWFFCTKKMSKETTDTLGNQKATNYALRANMTKEEFIKEVTDGLLPPPAYFPLNVKLNKEGYENIDNVIKNSAKPLSAEEFELLANETDAVILDVRHQSEFSKGFIPQSIFIGLGGTFAPWVGALIKDIKQEILLVTPIGEEESTITRLSRVGFDNVIGYLDGSFETWKKSGKEIDVLNAISVAALEEKIAENPLIFDVRKPGEYLSEHALIAENTPLDYLNDHISQFPDKKPFYVHCAGGYRSVIATSILKARGFHNVIDILGGFDAIKNSSIEKTAFVCPSTL